MSKPIWPKIPAGFVRAVLAGHSSLGLAFAALIYLVCFSGSVAVFAQEFHRWERPDAPQLTRVTPQAIQNALAQAVAKGGKAEHIYISPPQPESPRMTVTADRPPGEKEWAADASGDLVRDAATPWSEFMTRLHINLHLPQTWGIFVVGLTGVALLSSLISGVLAHPRVFKDAFHLRWGGSKRLQEADVHNRIGVWALPFHVMISLTGALLGLTTIIVGILALAVFKGDTQKAYALFIPPHPVDDPRPAPLPDLITPLLTIQQRQPGSTPSLVALEHPGEMGGAALVISVKPGTLSRGDTYTFDRQGRMMSESRMNRLNLGQKIIQVLGPIHFGWYGGVLVKLVYFLLGMGLTAVTSSGVAIWLARRRAKGRPAPRWERVWIATVWSQPAAYALSAVAAVLTPVDPLIVWAGATLAALATGLVWNPGQLSRNLRLAAAVLTLAVVAAHLSRWGFAVADPMALWTNAGLVLTAIALAASTLSRRKAEAAVAG